ncbi:MAG: hypothetical protein U9N13_06555 [Euryarchaeota archaeon]|nr:hypothetical protein [Euryarchaeota archaeon]
MIRPYRTLILSLLLMVITATAAGDLDNTTEIEITDIYSDIDSCDVTIRSSVALQDVSLHAQLVHEKETLDTRTIPLGEIQANSDIIRVIAWDPSDTDDGGYQVHITLLNNNDEICNRTHAFVHGHQVLPVVTIDSLISNSEGISALITPHEAVLLDIDYMLVDGSQVIYTKQEKRVPTHTQPLAVQQQWNMLLTNEHQYNGRIKVHLYDPIETTITSTMSFYSMDDARITDIYKDEIGASATIVGESQVPFDGSIRFTVMDDKSSTIQTITRTVPTLLTDDDETAEAIWDQTLPAGKYRLIIDVIGNDDDILDSKETIIDVEETTAGSDNDTATGTNGEEDADAMPGFLIVQTLSVLLISAFLLLRRKN